MSLGDMPRPSRPGELLILCYHAISDGWPTELAVSPNRLAQQARFFIRRGYCPTTLSEALSRPTRRDLVITFDDAFASVAELALPVLSALGVPATAFVPTAYVDDGEALEWSSLGRWRGTPFEGELRCMSWGQLRGLAGAGWEIGSHTHRHLDLTMLSDEQVEDELSTSRRLCEEHVQRPCVSFAYPFGAHDPRVMDAVARAGYEAAGILDNELAIPPGSLPRRGRELEPMRLLREGVYRRDGWLRLLAKTSAWGRRMRGAAPVRAAFGDC
jgi:peptidoglycan/xylan/chitin deacetylase (PgdA/CDA1 family)